MAIVIPQRKNIQEEDVRYKASVSEAVGFKLAAGVNFINERQIDVKEFHANGRYGIMSTYPQINVDGRVWFQLNSEIVGVLVFHNTSGFSGTTELDIKKTSDGGATWNSIFSTTPKITSTASANSHCVVDYITPANNITPTGYTAPVLITNNFDAKDVFRFDIISAQSGGPENTGIIINYRPR